MYKFILFFVFCILYKLCKSSLHKKNNLSIAVCISGCIRSFPRASYREGLKRLLTAFPKAHFFLVLKRNDVSYTKHQPLFLSKAGVDGFMKTMDIIRHNTKNIIIFDKFENKKIDKSIFASQIRMIDMCLNTAAKYYNYDFYVRYRPDFVLIDTLLPKDLYSIDENTIYTARKFDAIGNDQVFMFSKKLKKEWWDKYVMPTTQKMLSSNEKTSPEYFIFDKKSGTHTVKNGPFFYGGLLRTNENHIVTWDEKLCTEHTIIDDWKQMTLNIKPYNKDQLLLNVLIEQRYPVQYQNIL